MVRAFLLKFIFLAITHVTENFSENSFWNFKAFPMLELSLPLLQTGVGFVGIEIRGCRCLMFLFTEHLNKCSNTSSAQSSPSPRSVLLVYDAVN